jgi:hypothetical protein
VPARAVGLRFEGDDALAHDRMLVERGWLAAEGVTA